LEAQPPNGSRGRVDLRRPRERRLYKIDHFNENPAGETGRLLRKLRERIEPQFAVL
jgi:hypothetical protein